MERFPVDAGIVMYRQTPSASWSLDVHQDGQPRRRYSLKTHDRARALVIAREHARSILAGTWNVAQAQSVTIEKAVMAFKAAHSHHAANTKIRVKVALDGFAAFAKNRGVILIDKIRSELIEAFRDHRGAGKSAATVNTDLIWISSLCSWAEDRGYLRFNPAKKVKRAKVTKRVKFVPSVEAVQKFAASCSPAMRDIVLFLANTGLRVSEMIDLKPADVDLERKVIVVRATKTHEEPEVSLNEIALEIARLKKLKAGEGRLFQTKTGKPLSRKNVRKDMVAAARKANAGPINPHSLRRFFGTTLSKVVTTTVLQQLMRHKDIRTTQQHYLGKVEVSIPVLAS